MTRRKYKEHYSKEALDALDILVAVSTQYGRVPSFTEAMELSKKGILPHPNAYAFWCGGYVEAAAEVKRILRSEGYNDSDQSATTITPINRNNTDDCQQDPQQINPSQ